MLFKYISYLQLLWPFCSAERNHLLNFGRGHYGEHICEIILKGYFHLCPRMDFLQTLHINNSLYTNYENVFIELDS